MVTCHDFGGKVRKVDFHVRTRLKKLCVSLCVLVLFPASRAAYVPAAGNPGGQRELLVIMPGQVRTFEETVNDVFPADFVSMVIVCSSWGSVRIDMTATDPKIRWMGMAGLTHSSGMISFSVFSVGERTNLVDAAWIGDESVPFGIVWLISGILVAEKDDEGRPYPGPYEYRLIVSF